MGASGLLLGLAKLRGMRGVSLLTETYANQFHLGFNEARIVLMELKKILDLKIDLSVLEKEIAVANKEKTKIEKTNHQTRLVRKIKTHFDEPKPDVGYIG